MSIVIAAIYGLASLCLSMRMWIATGLTYGVCVFVVMTYVVVPLSAAPSRPAPEFRTSLRTCWPCSVGNAARRDWLIQDTTEMFRKLHERRPTSPRIQRSRAKDGAPASHPYAAGASRCYGTQCPLRARVRSRSGGPGVSHRLSRLRLAQSRFPTHGASQVRFRNGLVVSEGVPRAKRSAPIPRRKSRCWN